jgi:hypothetical protein
VHDCDISRQDSISGLCCTQVLSATGQLAGEPALLPTATAIDGTKAGATDGKPGSSQQTQDGVRQKVCWKFLHSCCATNAVVPAVPVQPLNKTCALARCSRRSTLRQLWLAMAPGL